MKGKKEKTKGQSIDEKRKSMVKAAEKHGLNSDVVLKKSVELDELIFDFMKKEK